MRAALHVIKQIDIRKSWRSIRYLESYMSSKFVPFLNTRCSVLASDQYQCSRAISFLTSERRIADANDL